MPVFEDETRESGRRESNLALWAKDLLDSVADADENGCLRSEGNEICNILEPLGLPQNVIAAVRLYPACREGLITIRTLEKVGDSELSTLVQGLVKLGRFSLPPDWKPGQALATRQSEALRKMLLAVVSDARLVVARIGEQLFRLRNAKGATESEQRAIALETREIYAPLANRLGIWQLKWELEDLAFRFADPVQYKSIATALNEKRAGREEFIAEIETTLKETLQEQGINATIAGRPKHIYSIWRKMQRKDKRLEDIFDIRAFRVLVEDIGECYAALGIVHNLWSYLPGEFDDYIANPKRNDYQSLHSALIGPEGRIVEVQIRTREMHRHAELGVAAHWRYKDGSTDKAGFDRKIRLLRHLLNPSDTDGDLLDQLRGDIFKDRVYAVSPRGDVVEMPTGATPLDFAYHVHTEIGHRCRGAKVNGRIVPLTYTVQNGDKIEIITAKQAQPSRDWLNPQRGYLAASRSRAKLRNWFRQQDRDQNLRQGREILERELNRLNVHEVPVKAIAKQTRMKDIDALYVALGAGDITSSSIASALQNLSGDHNMEVIRQRRARGHQASGGAGIAISGVGDLLYNFARCCQPVPPEHIRGYITIGRGVSIHRADCGNFQHLKMKSPEREVAVDWGNASDAIYPAELTVLAFDRQGLLKDISTVLTDELVSVESVRSNVDKKTMKADLRIAIAVPGLPTLSRTIERLEQIPNVTSVRRNG